MSLTLAGALAVAFVPAPRALLPAPGARLATLPSQEPGFMLATQLPRRAAPLRMLDVPRIELPSSVVSVLEGAGLKNPNEMSTRQYNEYSGAAIAGTLLFFLLPGALLFDVGDALLTVGKDFAFSALIGGGLAAYLSLRSDAAGKYANELGGKLIARASEIFDP
eukprot:CAMPEP_0119354176 /NCGR_PEP_ID=MMETSP1334-20130426/3212_1 /TAXON_ID=127549 /ORGANISM="Calcidiscus leptoporus, Strain RCC1130" /LENGTH=163 /DNA_ID=CAMNT_0007367661 /DNA_START=23 /DNA_END=514 /DNA_ORIENTATION=-